MARNDSHSVAAGARRRAKAKAAAVVALVAVAAGCGARGEWVYAQPGVTATQQARDEQACLQASVGTAGPGPWDFGAVIDREAFNECMARRGYSAEFVPR